MSDDKPKARRVAVYLDPDTEKAIRRRAEDTDQTVSRVAAQLLRAATTDSTQDSDWIPAADAAPVWDTPRPTGDAAGRDEPDVEDPIGPPAWLTPDDPDDAHAWRQELQAQLKSLLARYPSKLAVLERAAGLWNHRGLTELLASLVLWRTTLDHTPDADPRAEATWWTQGVDVVVRELEALTPTPEHD